MSELLPRGADEHIPHEERVVGPCADDTDIESVSLIPAGESVDDVNATSGIEIVNGALSSDAPDLRRRLAVRKRSLESRTRYRN